ncbi:aspartic proteinase A3-like [Impatiens glandulifera]|uniref:aspartic proteinase A3-like n=1 Tax=Impatiens glandulifera TaxID=253017 RepID=UPI001FB0BBA0|nr:aspartic proteinase A3-like [Impatiens glandulifera]
MSGRLSQDNVIVGGLIIKNQDFIEATALPGFVFSKYDGIIGLGFQELSHLGVVPVWYNMMNQGLIQNSVFSFWLNRNKKEEEGGELVFGGIDPKHHKGNHTYVPVTRKGYWEYIWKIGEGAAEKCRSGFISNEDDLQLWILGDIFMARYHIVFDYGKSIIGFVDAV